MLLVLCPLTSCVIIHLFQDLTKWKNRRRSTKSDLRRKSQDREHVINQMINGAVTNSDKSEAGGLLKRYPAAYVKYNFLFLLSDICSSLPERLPT